MKKGMLMRRLGHRYIETVYILECLIFSVLLLDKKTEHIGCPQKPMFLFAQGGIITQNRTNK